MFTIIIASLAFIVGLLSGAVVGARNPAVVNADISAVHTRLDTVEAKVEAWIKKTV